MNDGVLSATIILVWAFRLFVVLAPTALTLPAIGGHPCPRILLFWDLGECSAMRAQVIRVDGR